MANRDYGGDRGPRGRDYERADRGGYGGPEYDREYWGGRADRDYERGGYGRDYYRDYGRDAGPYEGPGYRGSEYGVGGRYEGGYAGYGGYGGGRGGEYRRGEYGGPSRERDERADRAERGGWFGEHGDRNPSQGFTGGFGGGYGSSYATSGDRVGRPGYDERSWREEGRGHAGRGSRNYRRRDERIEEDVHEALMRHPDVDATDIDVRVENGEVTLTGEVEDRRARRLAEEIAEQVSGVRDVHVHLKARRGLIDELFGGPDRERDRGRDWERQREREPGRTDREVTRSAERDTAAPGATSGAAAGTTRPTGTTGTIGTTGTTGTASG